MSSSINSRNLNRRSTISGYGDDEHVKAASKLSHLRVLGAWQDAAQKTGEEEDVADFNPLTESKEDRIARLYKHRSVFLLPLEMPLRQKLIRLTESKWFERAVLAVILLNCVVLAMEDPMNPDSEMNQILLASDLYFNIIFTIEMLLRISAMGFILHENSYLRSGWGWLDLIVVLTGWLAYLPFLLQNRTGNVKFSSLRALRALRPLRTIRSVQGMRVLVTAVINSLPLLLDVFGLIAFFTFIFAILGVYMWSGNLRQKCYIDNTSPLELAPTEPEHELCALRGSLGGGLHCGANETCLDSGVNPNQGVTSFDHMGGGLIIVLQCMTLEGWTDIMYWVQDSSSYWAWIYFTLLIFLGAFFAINLALAVIYEKFGSAQEEDSKLLKHKLMLAKVRAVGATAGKLIPLQKLVRQARGNAGSSSSLASTSTSNSKKLKKAMKKASTINALTSSQSQQSSSNLQKTTSSSSTITATSSLATLNQSTEPIPKSPDIPPEHRKLESQKVAAGGTGTTKALQRPSVLSESYMQRKLGPASGGGSKEGGDTVDDGGSDVRQAPLSPTRSPSSGSLSPKGTPLAAVASLPPGKGREAVLQKENKLQGILKTPVGYKPINPNSIRGRAKRAVNSRTFVYFIFLCIVINTIFLAIEHHGMGQTLKDVLRFGNYVFTGVFVMELVFKIVALGPAEYIQDRFNIFDFIIVALSVIELALFDGNQSITAMRAFRLLRIFKLMRSWRQLRELINVIFQSLPSVAYCSLLLVLFMFIYTVMGMQLFGGQFDHSKWPEGKPRHNFDNFLWSAVTVFQVLTGENWNEVMYDAMFATHWAAALYFVSLVTLGSFLILNLFQAILLRNFTRDDVQDVLHSDLHDILAGSDQEDGYESSESSDDDYTPRTKEMRKKLRAAQRLNMKMHGERQHDGQRHEKKVTWDQVGKDVMHPSQRPKRKGPTDELDTSLGDSGMSLTQATYQPSAAKRKELGLNLSNQKRPSTSDSTPRHSARSQGERDDWYVYADPDLGGRTPRMVQEQVRHELTHTDLGSSVAGLNSARDQDSYIDDSHPYRGQRSRGELGDERRKAERKQLKRNITATTLGRSYLDSSSKSAYRTGTVERILIAEIENETLLQPPPPPVLYGKVLFMPTEHAFRQAGSKMIHNPWFERTVLVIILLSSLALTFERPGIPPDSTEARVLFGLDVAFTVLFVLEMLLKMTVLGVVGHTNAYLRNPWNVLDAFVVFVSIVTLVLTSIDLSWLRALRAARPIRLVSRSRGMKMVLLSLVASLRPIMNVMIVCALFWLIFGILGVQLFAGKFYSCSDTTIVDRLQCIGNYTLPLGVTPPRGWEGPLEFPSSVLGNATSASAGLSSTLASGNSSAVVYQRRWLNSYNNFDHIGWAIVTMFEVGTLESWPTIMHLGVDAVSVDHAPVRDYNQWNSLFFVSFIIIGNFLLVNLFVGVVIDEYNRMKEAMEGKRELSKVERDYIEIQRTAMRHRPQRAIVRPAGGLRRFLFDVVNHPNFDYVIMSLIIINTIILAIRHDPQDDSVTDFLRISNYVFTGIFLAEALMKIVALNPMNYFRDNFNKFDFFLLLVAVADVFLGASDGIALTLRVMRVLRMFKLAQSSNGLRLLFRTLMHSLGALWHIGSLILLLFFVYAIMGVAMFGKVREGTYLNDHANFNDFPGAMLTLLRISTGEAWNGIMYDCMVEAPDCSPELEDCGSIPLAVFYFITFQIIMAFMLLNLMIAVILEYFTDVTKAETAVIKVRHVEQYRRVWAVFDPMATDWIPTAQVHLLVLQLPPPLGLPPSMPLSAALAFAGTLNIPDYSGLVHFKDVFNCLAAKAFHVKDIPLCEARARVYEEWKLKFHTSLSVQSQAPTHCVSDEFAAMQLQNAWRRYLRHKALHRSQERAKDPDQIWSTDHDLAVSHEGPAARVGSTPSTTTGSGVVSRKGKKKQDGMVHRVYDRNGKLIKEMSDVEMNAETLKRRAEMYREQSDVGHRSKSTASLGSDEGSSKGGPRFGRQASQSKNLDQSSEHSRSQPALPGSVPESPRDSDSSPIPGVQKALNRRSQQVTPPPGPPAVPRFGARLKRQDSQEIPADQPVHHSPPVAHGAANGSGAGERGQVDMRGRRMNPRRLTDITDLPPVSGQMLPNGGQVKKTKKSSSSSKYAADTSAPGGVRPAYLRESEEAVDLGSLDRAPSPPPRKSLPSANPQGLSASAPVPDDQAGAQTPGLQRQSASLLNPERSESSYDSDSDDDDALLKMVAYQRR